VSASQPDLLAAIVGAAHRRVADDKLRLSLEQLQSVAALAPRAPQRLLDALMRADRVNVIAECKRRSPSRGILRPEYEPAEIARAYERAGAVAISVLTEPGFFDGSLEHLQRVRAEVTLPILRKDFTVDPYQVWQSRAAGADAVLLIVRALPQQELVALLSEAERADLDALVEVHDESELERALAAEARLIGVNNRNLQTLDVDLGVSRRLAASIPSDVVAVAESGLRTADDIRELRELGYRGFLVGERFMTVADPGLPLRELLDALDAGASTVGSSALDEARPEYPQREGIATGDPARRGRPCA
jgi:indole-3-glycerol phosphate synthase